ncbi:MAG: nicotinate-nucleotide--dimethylbenzimidazole phosphoribosyltransferase [Caldilineaceae bacterium]|nr:nicotinate-nucleotide--dimethylbenzimidazole phosphoribosyltransferase [Caldilineaceae bacterium]
MSESLLAGTIGAIGVPDDEAMAATRARQEQLTKPTGALGRLEALSIQLAGISGQLHTPTSPRALIICAADHGITAEGVSAYPPAVTAQMVRNFLVGGAAVNVLARQMGASVTVLDVGVDADLPEHPNLIVDKVRCGTANFAIEPAMTADEAVSAVEVGIRAANRAIAAGAKVLIPGEMGIGNTTPSAAIAAVLTGHPVELVTGTGTGLTFAGWRHKCEVIRKALDLHKPSSADAVDLLRCVGGLEIAAIAGITLAGAAARIPVLLDGVIVTAGASIAARLAPACIPFLVAGHRSQEPGHRAFLDHLGILPLLDLDLRLGEGSGALLALPLLEASVRTLTEMATFAEAGVEKGKNDD